MSRHRVAQITEIPVGEGREFVVGDQIVALFNLDGTFHALDGICPHAGGPLARGKLTNGIVTCPWHGWQFDVTTGRHCLNSHLKQNRFTVEIEGDEIWVEIPSGSPQ